MAFHGTCFCKSFKFSVATAPEKVSECNCTFCTKRGALWAYYPSNDVEISVTGKGTWETEGGAKHNFCATCGCTTYSETPTYEPPEGGDPTDYSRYRPNMDKIQISIHARLFDDLDWRAIPVEELDGKNQW